MKRGDICWASLPDPAGSGSGFRRPVLVVQANSFNDSRISTTIVAVITSNLALADAPGNVRLAKSDSGLTKASVVNVSQVLALDRSLISKRIKTLPGRVLTRVDEGLRMVMGL